MKKLWTIFGLGLWVALLPFLGFPSSFKTFFFVLSGLFIALVAFLLIARKHYPGHLKAVRRAAFPRLITGFTRQKPQRTNQGTEVTGSEAQKYDSFEGKE